MTKKKSAVAIVDPRAEMLMVRADVKQFVEGKADYQMDHLGQYPSNMATARRTIIALQDLLDSSMESHKKATTRVRCLLAEHDYYLKTTEKSLSYAASSVREMSDDNSGLREIVQRKNDSMDALKLELRESREAMVEQSDTIGSLIEQLEAAHTTIKSIFSKGDA